MTETSVGGIAVSTLWEQYAPVPSGASAGSALLSAVGCASDDACFAIGGASSKHTSNTDLQTTLPVLEVKRKAGWSLDEVPFPGTYGEWNYISCVHDFCAALGQQDFRNGDSVPVADVYEGGRWRATTVPDIPKGAIDPTADEFACASDHTCLGVIDETNASDENVSEVAQFGKNKWTVQPLPVPATDSEVTKLGALQVACASVHTCTVIGGYFSGQVGENLLDVFSDGKWISTASSTTDYEGTSCSSSSCVVSTTSADGSAVYVVNGLAPLAVDASLSSPHEIDDLNCPAIGACVASIAPSATSYSVDQLATREHARWVRVDIAPAGGHGQLLTLIQCSVSGMCIVGGGYSRHQHNRLTLPLVDTVSHGRWTPHTILLPSGAGSKGGDIDALACSSAQECVAIGDIGDSINRV